MCITSHPNVYMTRYSCSGGMAGISSYAHVVVMVHRSGVVVMSCGSRGFILRVTGRSPSCHPRVTKNLIACLLLLCGQVIINSARTKGVTVHTVSEEEPLRIMDEHKELRLNHYRHG